MKRTLIIGATILAVTIGQPVTVNGELNVVSTGTNEEAKFRSYCKREKYN
ncbi:hypothetical protein [Cytobacillus sp. IB215665]|nr:hypothetical protein [Cytobacillus sp. IB215665]MDX8363933.1 hypothetical protein [Cytobacillus sp. IB215665]